MQDPTGIFSPIFESAYGYLRLSNLDGPDAKNLVASIMKCCRSPQAPQSVRGMLYRPDWRPHLVAAIALTMLPYEEETLEALWRAIDTGSWVTPQLAAAAFLQDKDFSGQARTRVQSGCKLHISQASLRSSTEEHGAGGAESATRRSAKTAASLARLIKLLPEPPSWTREALSSVAFLELLEEDQDNSGKIAEDWLNSLTKILTSLGVAAGNVSAS